MKYKELKEKKIEDLKNLLSEKKESLRTSRFGASGSKSRNVKEVMASKKDIARILTEINTRKTSVK